MNTVLNLLLLPPETLKKVALFTALGFHDGGQAEKVDTDNCLGDRECYRGWLIEQFPGVILYHLDSGHYWFVGDDEFPVAAIKRILDVSSH